MELIRYILPNILIGIVLIVWMSDVTVSQTQSQVQSVARRQNSGTIQQHQQRIISARRSNRTIHRNHDTPTTSETSILDAAGAIIPSSGSPHLRKSYKCLVYKIAEHNDIELKFRFHSKEGQMNNKNFTYHLKIGDEEYLASAPSKRKAQEAVAVEAVQRTTYRKPLQHDNMCVYTQSALNLVHEWSQQQKQRLTYTVVEEKPGPPRSYVIECNIAPNLTTRAEAYEKREAKLEAAEKMLPKINAIRMVNPLHEKRNEAAEIHPVSKLYEVQLNRREIEPVYKLKDEIPSFNHLGHKTLQFVMEVRVGNLVADGIGTTVKAAKREASKKMLQLMNISI